MSAKRPFHLMAKPIGPICNIRCEYCFYLSKEEMYPETGRSRFSMKEDVLEMFIRRYIEAQPEGTPEVIFAWQGGEPTLLPQAFYEKALELQAKYARKGMTVRNAFQTNGILVSRSRAEWFAANNFLLGVSVDGPEKLHNRYRIDRAGKGTFKDVMAGIENLKAAGCEFNTLTVVQNDNARHPRQVYEFLKSIGSEFFQFIPIVEPAGNGVSSRSVSGEAWGHFMTGIFDEWVKRDIGQIYVSHFDMLLGLYSGYPASFCVHSEVCGNAMAIEHNGDVYSCDHFVFPENHLGNVMETSLSAIADSDQQQRFGLDKRDTLPQECRQCPYLKLCWGGCPKNRLLKGRGGPLNWLCEGYKSLYSHTQPHFLAMARAIRAQLPASEFRRFFQVQIGRASCRERV